MKNLKTFEDFVNESYDNELLEKKILVPKIINNYFNGDKKGAKALKGWSFKIKDLEFKMKSLEIKQRDKAETEKVSNYILIYIHFHLYK